MGQIFTEGVDDVGAQGAAPALVFVHFDPPGPNKARHHLGSIHVKSGRVTGPMPRLTPPSTRVSWRALASGRGERI
jgi:hypothetical protein